MKLFSQKAPHLKNDFGSYQTHIKQYVGHLGLSIELDSNLDAPGAFLPETGEIILNRSMLQKKMRCSFEEILITIFHEIEHMREYLPFTYFEKNALLEYSQKEGKSYAVYENYIRDVFVNKEVLKHIPSFAPIMHDFYQDKLFPKPWLFSAPLYTIGIPKQYQFTMGLLRESFVPEEVCIVSKEVRDYIEHVRSNGIFHAATHGSLKERLSIIQGPLYDIFKKLYEDDKKFLKKHHKDYFRPQKNKDKQEDKKQKKGPSQGTPRNLQDHIHNLLNKILDKDIPKNPNPQENKQQKQSEKSHGLSQILNPKDYESLKNHLHKQIPEGHFSSSYKEEMHRVAKMYSSPLTHTELEILMKHLNDYFEYKKHFLDTIRDSKTQMSMIDHIAGIFENIKTSRQKKYTFTKKQLPQDKGEYLDAGGLVEGIIDLMNSKEALMWERKYQRINTQNHTKHFDLTLIADGSESMAGYVNAEQKRSILMILEAIKLLHDYTQDALECSPHPLTFETQALLFGREEIQVIKPKHPDFRDEERIYALNSLDFCSGYTNDYDAMRHVMQQVDSLGHDYQQSLLNGQRKHIVIVITHGNSHDGNKHTQYLKKLHERGVIVYGIGLQKESQESIGSYGVSLKPDDDIEALKRQGVYIWNSSLGSSIICEDASLLGQTLADILSPHLNSL